MANGRISLGRPGARGIGVIAAASLAIGAALPLASWAQVGGNSHHAAMQRGEAAATERHIATLRARLHITAAQEPLWKPMAAAMRKSVEDLDRVYAKRASDYDTLSAVDDLKSYAEVQQVQADNVRSLIAPFEQLYASFSPTQKREADETFRRFTENATKNSR